MPKLVDVANSDAKTTPSFVVTSGMLAKDPFPAMFSLAACKGGQYNLTHSLHKEFEPKGVHCALVVVGGSVNDESAVTNARNIAEETWEVFQQPKHHGKFETMLLDPAYLEHVKNREKRSV
jgi:short-subunit dehydrogenase